MKIKVWLDSGANIHSKREEIIELSDIGLTEEDWAAMAEEEREAALKPVAFETLDWGWKELDD